MSTSTGTRISTAISIVLSISADSPVRESGSTTRATGMASPIATPQRQNSSGSRLRGPANPAETPAGSVRAAGQVLSRAPSAVPATAVLNGRRVNEASRAAVRVSAEAAVHLAAAVPAALPVEEVEAASVVAVEEEVADKMTGIGNWRSYGVSIGRERG